MNIVQIIDIAKERNNFKSDRELSRKLKVSHSAVAKWRAEVDLPSIGHSHKLATLAGLDPAEIITDVLIQGENDPAVLESLFRIKTILVAKAIAGVALVFCILCKIKSTLNLTNKKPNVCLLKFQPGRRS